MAPLLFFIGIMTVFYQSQKWQSSAQLQTHLENIKDLVIDQINHTEDELKSRATMISSNLLLQEYLFIVADLDGDPDSLQEQYKKQVGTTTREKHVLLTFDGRPIIGKENKAIINFLKYDLEKKPPAVAEIEYFFGQGGLWLITRIGMFYKERLMGQVALAVPLNLDYFKLLKRRSGGDFFLTYSKNLLFSTHKSAEGKEIFGDENDLERFELTGNTVVLDDILYSVGLIPLESSQERELPELWIGISQQKMAESLGSLLSISIKLLIVGGLAMLGFGILITYKVVKPIEDLVELTQSVAEGNFPEIKKVEVHDEMDYLTERFYSMINNLKENQEKINQAQQLLKRQAITDPMTGLYNRRYFDEILPKLLTFQAREGDMTLYLLLLDIDHFKNINDTYGHPCGDNVLVAFSDMLKKSVRDSDFCFRIGGEEFVILLHAKNMESTINLANNIRTRIQKKPVHYWGEVIYCTVSIGVVETEKELTPDQLLRRSDDALYEAKRLGRNRVCVAS